MFDDEFNFEYWHELSIEDPDRFERERHALLDGIINSAPEAHRERLRAVQNRADMVRQKYKDNHTGCATAMYMEMMRSVVQLSNALKGVDVVKSGTSAEVIDFKGKRDDR